MSLTAALARPVPKTKGPQDWANKRTNILHQLPAHSIPTHRGDSRLESALPPRYLATALLKTRLPVFQWSADLPAERLADLAAKGLDFPRCVIVDFWALHQLSASALGRRRGRGHRRGLLVRLARSQRMRMRALGAVSMLCFGLVPSSRLTRGLPSPRNPRSLHCFLLLGEVGPEHGAADGRDSLRTSRRHPRSSHSRRCSRSESTFVIGSGTRPRRRKTGACCLRCARRRERITRAGDSASGTYLGVGDGILGDVAQVKLEQTFDSGERAGMPHEEQMAGRGTCDLCSALRG